MNEVMVIEELEALNRANTQREVLLCLIEKGEAMTSREIAEILGISVNAVNIALFNLNNKKLIERISRGIYTYRLGPILVVLLQNYFSEQ
jgi:predicted ArsR family transcriptional regulator